MTAAVQELPPAGEGVLFDDRVFAGFFTVVAVLAVAGLVLFVWLLVRNVRLAHRVGPALGRHRGAPLSQRLQELDELHRRGLITDAEHQLARHRVLTSP